MVKWNLSLCVSLIPQDFSSRVPGSSIMNSESQHALCDLQDTKMKDIENKRKEKNSGKFNLIITLDY